MAEDANSIRAKIRNSLAKFAAQKIIKLADIKWDENQISREKIQEAVHRLRSSN